MLGWAAWLLPAPAAAQSNGFTFTAIPQADVGLTTVTFRWTTGISASIARTAQIGPANCNFGAVNENVIQSSTTFRDFVVFGDPGDHSPDATGTGAGALTPNVSYCMRVTTAPISEGNSFSTTVTTATYATVAGVGTYQPTPASPNFAFNPSTPVYISTNAVYFKASTGDNFASNYRTAWNQTQNYTFLGSESIWNGGNEVSSVTATSAGAWYHHVFPGNPRGVFGTTRTVQTFFYDATAPSQSNFRAVSSTGGEKIEATWIDTANPSEIRLTVQDSGSGLNTLGYSSGTHSSLLGLWHFDEGSGVTAFNDGKDGGFTKSEINGTLSTEGGTRPYYVAGRFGSALNFIPGMKSHVRVNYTGFGSDPLDLGGGNSYLTISAWIKINATSAPANTEHYVVGRWDNQVTDNHKYLLLVTNATGDPGAGGTLNRPAFYYRVSGDGFDRKLIAPGGIPTGTWTHVAAVVNGNDGAGNSAVSLYVNGVLSTSTVQVGTFLLASQPGTPVVIGADNNVGNARSNYFDGAIDEVKIYNPGGGGGPATTADQIALDLASGIGWTPHVFLSTTGGTSWQLVSSSNALDSPRWQMSPDPGHGTTAAATFKLLGADLGTSTSTLTGSAGTNQLRFVFTDRAGNETNAGAFTVLVDTTVPSVSTFRTQTSTGGTILEAGWSPLAQGLTVYATVQDVTSGLDLTAATYEVQYTTTNGSVWNNVPNTTGPGPYVLLTGTSTTNDPQTFSLKDVGLAQSVPETRNRVRFVVRDRAGKATSDVALTEYVVRVDTTAPSRVTDLRTAVPYANRQVRLDWTSAGDVNRDLSGTLHGSFHLVYTTTDTDAESLTIASPGAVELSTQNVALGSSHFHLLSSGLSGPGATYYFRLFARDPAGNLSPLSVGATATTLSTPSPPTITAATVLGVSSIQWTWSQTVLTSSYTVFSDTDSANFITAVSTPVGSFTRLSLSTNTIYGLQLKSHNPAGPSAITSASQKYTFAAQPGNPVVSAVGVGSFTFTWDTRGNPGYTRYEVTAATEASFTTPANQIAFAQGFTASATTFSGLGRGATYYVHLQAENNEAVPVLTALTAVTTPYTLPNAPAALAGAALGTSSITWTWDSNASGAATRYRVRMASGTQLATNLHFQTTTFVETGLSTNTATAITVESLVPMTTNTATFLSGGLTLPTTIFTLAAKPGQAAMTAATTGHLAVNWDRQGNPLPGAGHTGTRYEVTYGQDPAFAAPWSTAAAFGTLTSTFTSILGLQQGTSYYFRARAQNNDDERPVPTTPIDTAYGAVGLAPTVPVPVASSSVFTNVLTTESIKWHWNPNGNGGATQYRLTRTAPGPSTPAFGHVSSTFTETGLGPNVFYDLKVEAFTTSGQASITTATGAYTLANPPNSLQVIATSSTTATLQWSANSNSSFTQYQVRMSTDAPPLNPFDDTDIGVAGFSAGMTVTSVTISGLAPFTTHFFRVRARNGGGGQAGGLINTDFSAIVSTFTGAPVMTGITAAAQGVSSITWTWEPVLNASGYDVFMASWSVGASTPLASPTTNTLTLTQLGGIALSTNTAYGIKVRAFNTFGFGPISAITTRYTLAAAPGDPAVAPVSTMTVSLSWDLSGNPAGTRMELSQSTDGFAANFSTPIAFAQNFTAGATTLTGLASGTTYSFRVRARNDDTPVLETAFSNAASTRTLGIPGQIDTLSASGFFPGQIDLAWTSKGFNGTNGVITDGQYVISVATFASFAHSTFTVAGSTMVIAFPTSTVSGVQQSTSIANLAEGTTYFFRVFLRNDEQVYSAASSQAAQLAHVSARAFTIDFATAGLAALGSLTTSSSVVVTAPVTLVSTGNVALTYVLSVATATPASPWGFATPTGSPGTVPTAAEDRVRFFGAFHPTLPPSASFASGGIENIVTPSTAAASLTRFTINGAATGEAIPAAFAPGSAQTRKLWLRLDMPPYTTTGAQQDLRLTINATSP